MVLFTLSKHLTRLIGPPLFRNGLALRNWFAPPLSPVVTDRGDDENDNNGRQTQPGVIGISSSSSSRTQPWFGDRSNNYLLDMTFLIPYSQKLLSLAAYDEMKRQEEEALRSYSSSIRRDAQPGGKASSSSSPPTPATPSDVRVRVLEDVLRPCLLPTLRWSPDVERGWRYNVRVVAWARSELLVAKHGPAIRHALEAYPTLRASPQLQRRSGAAGSLLLNLARHGRIDLAALLPTGNGNGGGGAAGPGGTTTATTTTTAGAMPSSSVVVKAFGMQDWATTKNTQAVREAMVPTVRRLGGYVVQKQQQQPQLPSSSSSADVVTPAAAAVVIAAGPTPPGTGHTNHAVIPSGADLADVSLEDVLDVVTGGHVATSGPLNALCLEANFYQLWTKEYIEHLGDYLLDRASSHSKAASEAAAEAAEEEAGTGDEEDSNESGYLLVLDVGAGDGLLTRCLQEYMEKKVDKEARAASKSRAAIRRGRDSIHVSMPTLVATDDMSWGIFAKAEVERLSVRQALQKYVRPPKDDDDDMNDGDRRRTKGGISSRGQAVVVLCSWMPMGQDWTALFRASGVEEYILIGEADDGSCGHNWKTWGNHAFFDPTEESDADGNAVASGGGWGGAPAIPPYEADGYQRWDMDVLSQFQFSSFDCSVSKSSKTVSFRKQRR